MTGGGSLRYEEFSHNRTLCNQIESHVIGFDSPTNNYFAQLAFEVYERFSESEIAKKEPITSEMIKSLVNKFGGTIVSLPDL